MEASKSYTTFTLEERRFAIPLDTVEKVIQGTSQNRRYS